MAKPTKKSEDKEDREGNELIEKLVGINRVAKVVKGGKRFAMAAIVVIGDGKGRVGIGTGKAREVPDAIQEGYGSREAQAAPRSAPRRPHDPSRCAKAVIGAGKVVLRTAPAGTGIIAGGPMRAVFEALGVRDIVAKSVGSSNPHNMIKATFDALEQINSPRSVAVRRGKKVNEIIGKKQADMIEGKE